MIKEEKREHIATLIREYKSETGEDATSGGKITKQFEEWRKLKKKKRTN
jgi:hypothetical protein